MWVRALGAVIVGMGIMLSATPAHAQISGRVIIEEGPIGVDVVFGPRPSVVVEYGDRRPRLGRRAPAYDSRRPVRYVRGMSLVELERYMAWIEAEYRYFRGLHPDDAYYELGWSEWELYEYVDWLKEERRFLRKEHKWLRKSMRKGGPFIDHPGRGRGPPPGVGRGRRGGPHGGGDFRDDWEDRWEDAWEDREDAREDWEDEWEDRWEDREEEWDDDDRRRRDRDDGYRRRVGA